MTKEEIIKICGKMGFALELDRWDEPNKSFIRLRHNKVPQEDSLFAVIFYKCDAESDLFFFYERMSIELIKVGKFFKSQEILKALQP